MHRRPIPLLLAARVVTVVVTVAATATLTGCGGHPSAETAPPPSSSAAAAPTPNHTPAAPAALHWDGKNPCQVLTPPQIAGLGTPSQLDLGSAGCTWSASLGQRPLNSWRAGVGTSGLGPGYLSGNPPLRVDGYPAEEPAAAGVDPKTGCELYIDTAPDQTLHVSFTTTPDYPGINHQVACGLAARVADLIIRNVGAKAGLPTPTLPALAVLSRPQLPPRPAAVTLTGADPCALLTADQAGQLQLPAQGAAGTDPDGPTCTWLDVDRGQWQDKMLATTNALSMLDPGAAAKDTSIVTLGGWTAVESTSPPFRADQACTYDIDVADHQDLRVEYNNPPSGGDHAGACRTAAAFATELLTTLRATAGH
jgi:hypothetical protein